MEWHREKTGKHSNSDTQGIVCDGEYSGDDDCMECGGGGVSDECMKCEVVFVAGGGGVDEVDVVGNMEFEIDIPAGACDAGGRTSCDGGCVSGGGSVVAAAVGHASSSDSGSQAGAGHGGGTGRGRGGGVVDSDDDECCGTRVHNREYRMPCTIV